MELRHMRAFAAVAEHLHFRKAAESLGITQPGLSQQLSALEKELGAELVVRTSREVGLTAIGELFLESCHRTLMEVNRSEEIVREATSGISGRLVIGTLGAGANGPLPGLIKAFRDRTASAAVELRHFPDSARQERDLQFGSIDLAVVRSISSNQMIESDKLFDESFFAYMPTTHRLAQRDEIALSELANESFVIWPRELGPEYYDSIVGACRTAGFEPRIDGFGSSLETQLALVAAHVGVSLQAASNGSISRAGLTAVPLSPADLSSPLWLAWRRWQRSRSVNRFLEIYRSGEPRTNVDEGSR